MALTRPWQEAYPDNDNYGFELDDYQRQIRTDVRERLAVQHKAYLDETGHTDVGEHTPGECTVSYVGLKSAFPTPATTTKGCVAIATDEGNQQYYWTGSAWSKVQEPMMITGDQIIAGAKTFSGAVTLSAVSNIKNGTVLSSSDAPTTDPMIPNKKYVDDQINDKKDLHDVNDVETTIYTKYFTGTADADSSTNIAHGITNAIAKILSVNAVMYSDSVNKYMANMTGGSVGGTFKIMYDATNIILDDVTATMQGNGYRVQVDYIL